MCAWLQMPANFDASDVLLESRRRGVSFKPGGLFSSAKYSPPAILRSSANSLRSCSRLVVAHYDESTLERGMQTLCGVLAEAHLESGAR
jgi:DNA-binding transcriptional MocR family regulator